MFGQSGPFRRFRLSDPILIPNVYLYPRVRVPVSVLLAVLSQLPSERRPLAIVQGGIRSSSLVRHELLFLFLLLRLRFPRLSVFLRRPFDNTFRNTVDRYRGSCRSSSFLVTESRVVACERVVTAMILALPTQTVLFPPLPLRRFSGVFPSSVHQPSVPSSTPPSDIPTLKRRPCCCCCPLSLRRSVTKTLNPLKRVSIRSRRDATHRFASFRFFGSFK